ncbi:MAG TPA: LysR family transcriptional regulator [Amnibacterium sp.]|jgi:DNA-binding transcriptional LysR family regulator|nr:LysR family transcriptional regulator [Amnibacterium sp.]
MELRQLEAFLAVADAKNFTRAASRLFVAQSGLSATIRSLERDVNAALFFRTTRSVRLTAAGEALLPEARRTLASARAAVESVHGVQGLRSGTVDVGFMQAGNITELLARYRSTYPGIQIRLRQAASADLATMLADGLLDVIFTTAVDEPPPGIVSIPILRSPLVVAGGTDAVLGGTSFDLADAAQHQLVGFPPGWGVRELVDRAMRAAGVEPHVDLEVNDTTTLLDLVAAGLGIAVIPTAIARLRTAVATAALTGRAWQWVVAAQTTAPMPRNPAGRALWDMVNEGGHQTRRPWAAQVP